MKLKKSLKLLVILLFIFNLFACQKEIKNYNKLIIEFEKIIKETHLNATKAKEVINISNNNYQNMPSEGPINEGNYNIIPDILENIPQDYLLPIELGGKVEAFEYDTYEAFSYDDKGKAIKKRAWVYLPYGYDENKEYDIIYLMHGRHGNEKAFLGINTVPSDFKYVLDHLIINEEIKPVIVVSLTYNNITGDESKNEGLSYQLTASYHKELINDVLPQFENKYATYASSAKKKALKNSRDHRYFGGFSLGGLCTWYIFENCLDYFKYYFPLSGGNIEENNKIIDTIKNSKYDIDDYFIYALSGNQDEFGIPLKNQVNDLIMNHKEYFIEGNTLNSGNIIYRELENGIHDWKSCEIYLYNVFKFFFGIK